MLVLFAIRTHQRLSEQTHLSFETTLRGQPVSYEVAVTLDNSPFTSGARIGIGQHQLTLQHPKAEPFSTNLFIWYGKHDLGELALKRSTGSLRVTANPPAGLIDIRGAEFSLRLTNSPGLTMNVPTDAYTVEAHYEHWQQTEQTSVGSMIPGTCAFAPRLGAAQLTCNQSGASFQVLNAREQLVEAGGISGGDSGSAGRQL